MSSPLVNLKVNSFTGFIVKTPAKNKTAVYDLGIKGRTGTEYEDFLQKDEIKGHPDLHIITYVVEQLLKERRLINLPGEKLDIKQVGQQNKGFFRDETPTKDIRKDMKNTNNFVAIPAKNKKIGLRLFCLQWDYSTIVLMNGFDKKGWPRSYQSDDRLWGVVEPLLAIFELIYDAIESFGDYSVNKPDIGFIRGTEKSRCERVNLQRYIS